MSGPYKKGTDCLQLSWQRGQCWISLREMRFTRRQTSPTVTCDLAPSYLLFETALSFLFFWLLLDFSLSGIVAPMDSSSQI